MKSVLVSSKTVKAGDRFGKLVVAGQSFRVRGAGQSRVWVVCDCDCGNVYVGSAHHLGKAVVSCGCHAKQRARLNKHATKHGLWKHQLYHTWSGMVKRCTNEKCPAWKNYGARGISVCDEWSSDPREFIEWAATAGWSPGLELDRIDNNAGYSPSNCRFVTRTVNANNRRVNVNIDAWGEAKTASEWSRDRRCNVSLNRILKRLELGWGGELAISTPALKDRNGENNTSARLTALQVDEIRTLRASGVSLIEVAKRFGINAAYAWQIVAHKRRKNG
jgi:hypothetical protein